MRERAILEALDELERWQARELAIGEELRKAQRQVQYYEALVRDMKRDVKPARFEDLLRAF
ncbi:MAG TPA: hypothetical protein VGR28_15470 [Candidatus Thermoplasmatota archaeon]|jgi:hypothetical protein|nr:hypothetical protein [Candidatus Thermoplasmatota archaeon]